MAKAEIALEEHVDRTLQMMKAHGLLLGSVGEDGRPNAMTIGWGSPGIIWGRPIFAVYVRPSRFTYQNIEATGEFVVNVPSEEMHQVCLTCGTLSGRDVDKFAECELAAAEAETVRVPLIAECVRHYECRVVHRNDVLKGELAEEIVDGCYPQGDFHRVYFGEILRVTEST